MTVPSPGDLFLVPFPFSDLSTEKKRPALILKCITTAALPALFITAMVTSQIGSEAIVGDYLLQDWKESGLLHSSKVRLAKLVTLEEDLLIRKLGSLTKKDKDQTRKVFRKLFADWL